MGPFCVLDMRTDTQRFRPGDIIAIAGTSCRSRLIQACTAASSRGISHVAIISQGQNGPHWWEASIGTSTPDCVAGARLTGVGCYSIKARLDEEAARGTTVWHYRLRQPLNGVDTDRLDAWLRAQREGLRSPRGNAGPRIRRWDAPPVAVRAKGRP